MFTYVWLSMWIRSTVLYTFELVEHASKYRWAVSITCKWITSNYDYVFFRIKSDNGQTSVSRANNRKIDWEIMEEFFTVDWKKNAFRKTSVCLSYHLSVYLSVGLSAYLSVYLSVYLPLCLPVCLSVLLFAYLPVCLRIFCLSAYLSVCLPICAIHLSVCLSTYLPV